MHVLGPLFQMDTLDWTEKGEGKVSGEGGREGGERREGRGEKMRVLFSWSISESLLAR